MSEVNLFAQAAAEYQSLTSEGLSPSEANMLGGWQRNWAGYTPADMQEAAIINTSTAMPAGSEGMTPFERSILFGFSKALDAAPAIINAINGNTATGSFAGQNGATYQQRPTGGVAPQVRADAARPAQDNTLQLLMMAGAAYLLLG